MSETLSRPYQDQRRKVIEGAAYHVLSEKGYKAASMLAIARKAKASNETLYNWYGNKQGLFGSLVERNTKGVKSTLEELQDDLGSVSFAVALEKLGLVLLEMVTSERAIALNRAAAGDVHDTGALGLTIAEAGKNTVLPMVAKLFAAAKKNGAISFTAKDQIEEIWISLLIGDLQIQRVIGAKPLPDEKFLKARAERAARLVMRLYAN